MKHFPHKLRSPLGSPSVSGTDLWTDSGFAHDTAFLNNHQHRERSSLFSKTPDSHANTWPRQEDHQDQGPVFSTLLESTYLLLGTKRLNCVWEEASAGKMLTAHACRSEFDSQKSGKKPEIVAHACTPALEAGDRDRRIPGVGWPAN